jgi:hypothetical protein
MTSQSARILASLLLSVALGCAAKQEREPSAPAESAPARSPAFATPPPPAPEPTTDGEAEQDSVREEGLRAERDELASAQAELVAARRELELALGPAKVSKPSATGGAAPPAAAAPSRARPSDAANEAPKGKADKKSSESSCQTACRAFQSLGRAAGSICRLAGDKDDRCGQARAVVSQAERRVTTCGCKSE